MDDMDRMDDQESGLPDRDNRALPVFFDDPHVRLDAEARTLRDRHLAAFRRHRIAKRRRLQIGVEVFEQGISRERRDDVDRGEIAGPENRRSVG